MTRGFFSKALPVLFIAVSLGGALWYTHTQNPCISPLTYRVGTFDARFGVSESEFISAMEEAAGIWNKAAGKTVLSFDAKGALPVNLVYDSREAATQKTQTLESSVSAGKAVADSVKEEYASLKSSYDADAAAYENDVTAYQAQLDAYNQEVDYWNGKGGAPRAEYEKLSEEKQSLAHALSLLEAERAALNAKAASVNALIDKYNLVVDHVNANVNQINQNAGREFEEGEYVSDASGARINVYEFNGRAKLVRLLAHEMGHALGLPHNDNPDSIMYYLNESTNLSPTAEDTAALSAACRAK